ncbi:MAG: DUF3459 domain-containing protein [Calditrichaeota bacterium]|nr:DUF3459 domain-containing protein [Calditrichota bacterium]
MVGDGVQAFSGFLPLIFGLAALANVATRRRRRFGVVEGNEDLAKKQARQSPEWVRQGVIYEVFPRAFTPEGTLRGVLRKLPELAELGVNILWLMPIHPIGVKGRKGRLGSPYAVKNYFEVHPDLGTKEDLRTLVEQAHDLGIRVILDFVANHVALDYDDGAVQPHWFQRDGAGNAHRRVPDWTDVVEWDYGVRQVWEYVAQALEYWVKECDVDGYRCDVAGLVPLKFWEEVRERLERLKPEIFLLAEWSDPRMHLSAFDATYDWSLYDVLVDVRNGLLPASAVLDVLQHEEKTFPRGSLRLRFLENHDEKRSADVFGLDTFEPYATLIFTLSGIPLLYNGQEYGDDVRPSLFEAAQILQQPVNPLVPRTYRELIRLRREHPVFREGDFTVLPNDVPAKIVTFARSSGDEAAVVVLNLNNSTTLVNVELPASLRHGREDWLFHFRKWQALRLFRRERLTFELEPYEAVVMLGEAEAT